MLAGVHLPEIFISAAVVIAVRCCYSTLLNRLSLAELHNVGVDVCRGQCRVPTRFGASFKAPFQTRFRTPLERQAAEGAQLPPALSSPRLGGSHGPLRWQAKVGPAMTTAHESTRLKSESMEDIG
jgi:hypothetical protein